MSTPPVADQQAPKPSAPSPDARLNHRGVVITAVLGLVGVVITAIVSTQLARNDSDTTPAAPPRLSISSVEWLDNFGRFKITGTVENLGDHQLIWTYNQPYNRETGDPDVIFPNPGPCPVDRKGTFSCQLGFAGERDAQGQKFVFWAAIVTDEQAYDAATVESGQEGRHAYSNPTEVPHVSGEETLDSFEEVRPRSQSSP